MSYTKYNDLSRRLKLLHNQHSNTSEFLSLPREGYHLTIVSAPTQPSLSQFKPSQQVSGRDIPFTEEEWDTIDTIMTQVHNRVTQEINQTQDTLNAIEVLLRGNSNDN